MIPSDEQIRKEYEQKSEEFVALTRQAIADAQATLACSMQPLSREDRQRLEAAIERMKRALGDAFNAAQPQPENEWPYNPVAVSPYFI